MSNQTEETIHQKARHEEDDLLVDIGRQLQEAYAAGTPWQLPDRVSEQLAMLDELARRNNRAYSLFDFERFDFLFCSSNLADLAGDDHACKKNKGQWNPKYLSVIQDHKSITDFLAVRNKIVSEAWPNLGTMPQSSVGGGSLAAWTSTATT